MAYNYMEETISEVYERLNGDKQSSLTRAEDSAKLTIPSVFPSSDFDDTTSLDDVYQSLGARAVLSLASKLLQSLFPVNQTFFKLLPSKELEEQILSGEDPKLLDTLNAGLVKLETGLQHEMDRQSIRTPLHEALKLSLVTGNALLWKEPKSKKGFSVFTLRNYCVKRDTSGNLLDLVIREKVSPRTLPEDIVLTEEKEDVYIYTRMVNDGEGNYQKYQEVEDKVVAGSDETFRINEDTTPFIILRWTSVPNSNYGRGLVEHYIGDLRNYEAMNMVMVDLASVMSKVVYMVNPNTQHGTDVEDLNNATTGDYIAGHADDITVPQTNKNSDLNALLNYMQTLELRLSQAFLLFTSRDAERVTAKEIARTAQQLEETLGGVYSLLSDELQKPLLSLFIKELNIKLDTQIEPVITSGLEALGRGNDANKLMQFIEGLGVIPEGWNEVNKNTLVNRLAYATGIDVDNLIKTVEQKEAEQKAMQEQAMQQQLGASMAQNGGKVLAEQAGANPQLLQ